MNFEIDDMTFVITGAAHGIGASTAKLAAEEGANVMVADVDATTGEALVDEIRDAGGNASYCHCDVSDAEQVEALMRVTAETFGGIDVVHNNAGVHETMLDSDVSIENMALESWDKVMAINLRGPWLCSKFAIPYLKESRRAPSVINAGSTGSWAGYPSGLAYGPSKGGIALFTKNLAVELAKYGIRSNCYCPGSTETRMVNEYLDAAPDKEALLRSMTGTHLVPRLGEPVEVAKLVCFLASEASSFVNGVVWLIDGGSLAWRGTNDAIGV